MKRISFLLRFRSMKNQPYLKSVSGSFGLTQSQRFYRVCSTYQHTKRNIHIKFQCLFVVSLLSFSGISRLFEFPLPVRNFRDLGSLNQLSVSSYIKFQALKYSVSSYRMLQSYVPTQFFRTQIAFSVLSCLFAYLSVIGLS